MYIVWISHSFNSCCLHLLRTFHTLSSDLPLMRFFIISPQQKISSLHTGSETVSEFEVFSKRITFWNIQSNFICFLLTNASCQLGWYTRKLLLIPIIAMKSGNALDLPLSGISLNISIILDCMNNRGAVSSSPVLFILVRKLIFINIYFIDRSLKIRWSSGYGVGPTFSGRVGEMVQSLTGAIHM